MRYIVFILLFGTILSCKKKSNKQCPPQEQWEKFVGEYNVYDTLGTYLFDAEISHYSGVNGFGNEVDSIIIQDFSDTLDLKFKFSFNINLNYLNIRFHDSVSDYNNKSWHVSRFDDLGSDFIVNEMNNDTLILNFRMTNLPYYINESVPYFDCLCKHVYVKK